mmetsp:Transcript_18579/g.50396  ORF Transcript_18579/g.50396 Transcript_18579/m.50396 type:complete len:361 (-) Transcript_18579:39-1121(-)
MCVLRLLCVAVVGAVQVQGIGLVQLKEGPSGGDTDGAPPAGWERNPHPWEGWPPQWNEWSEVANVGIGDSPLGPRSFAWFHPPKTATSFGATLFHYANASLPRDEGAELLTAWYPFFHYYPPAVWFRDGVWHSPCDHAGVTDEVYERFHGRFVGIFREPRSRIVSAWNHMNAPLGEDVPARMNGTVSMQLAGQAQGEMYMFRPGHDVCRGHFQTTTKPKPKPDVSLAMRRLREGFKFVGIMEEYDLSVCLFHAMFGGECLPVEFANMRPGQAEESPGSATVHRRAKVEAAEDDADTALYNAARERFWADVKTYGVGRRLCRRLCHSVHGVFGGIGKARKADCSDAQDEYDWPNRWRLVED